MILLYVVPYKIFKVYFKILEKVIGWDQSKNISEFSCLNTTNSKFLFYMKYQNFQLQMVSYNSTYITTKKHNRTATENKKKF